MKKNPDRYGQGANDIFLASLGNVAEEVDRMIMENDQPICGRNKDNPFFFSEQPSSENGIRINLMLVFQYLVILFSI